MKLIIEGPDLSGKTTAIEKIAKYYNSGVIIKNNFKPRSLEDTEAIFEQYCKILDMVNEIPDEDLVILDRFYPSQCVYSYLRGRDEMHSTNMELIEEICFSKDYTYIYLDTDLEILKDRYKQRGDEHIKIDDLLKLKLRYDIFYEKTRLTKYKVDTMKDNWLEILIGKLK